MKLQIIAIMQVNIAHSICNLKYSIPKETIVIFHDGSKYDYHFTIKELAEEFERNLLVQEKILKNTQFFSSYRKRRFGKSGNKITKVISWKFFDSTRFMTMSSSDLVNNLAEEAHKIECKYGHDKKKHKTCGIK